MYRVLYLLKNEKVIIPEDVASVIEDYLFTFDAKSLETYFEEQKLGAKVLSEAEEYFAPKKEEFIEIVATNSSSYYFWGENFSD